MQFPTLDYTGHVMVTIAYEEAKLIQELQKQWQNNGQERRMNMKKNEKENFALGVHIAGLYGACDSRTKEALIMAFLEDIRETDFTRWLRIMNKNILE